MKKITKDHPLSKSEDILQSNIETLKSLFPTIVKEGKIDLKELEALLSDEIETSDEYYRFNWAGKSDARREANKPTTATLRPVKEESKNWDTTENIFIEGDNLEVLKLLQKSYANQIKMIYIDPPYNTGHDFVYKDNYSDNLNNYLMQTGQINDDGYKIATNSENDGRYHSNWLNMMYPRLKLARNLLRDDGMVFISIDDNEVTNLRKICDEIFGEDNFIDVICWKKKYGGGAKEKYLVSVHEYILLYAKRKVDLPEIFIEFEEEKARRFYKFKDEKFETLGYYRTHPLEAVKSFDLRDNLNFPVIAPDGQEVWPKRQWRWSKDRFNEALAKGEVIFSKNKSGEWVLSSKQYLNDENGDQRKTKAQSLIDDIFTQEGTKEVLDVFGDAKIFSFPKPLRLLYKLIEIGGLKDEDIILDFFAGSGTTAHAILNINKEDAGKRKFICIQMPESTDENGESYKAGYKKISDITKDRISKASSFIEKELLEKIEIEKKKSSSELKLEVEEEIGISSEEILQNLDLGFKSFKLDTSNINAWDGSVANFEKNLLNTITNIKIDRTEEDVLFEVLLKYGLNLTVPIEEKIINNCKVYSVGLGTMFVCLSDNITTEVAEELGKWKEQLNPTSCRVLFKDNGFKDDVAKTNSIQILKRFAIQEINSI